MASSTTTTNMEPTPLPSTGILDQPEGLQPEFSAHTNAFIDRVQFPPHETDDEQSHLDDLVNFRLPEPHHHVAAPSPDDLPDPPKFSTPMTTPAKRKPKAKATPKAPAKRRRRADKTPSRSPSPTSTWTLEDKRKLRTLKSDEKSCFSWKVISTKMGKTESDVRAVWNQIKDTCG